MVRVREDRSVSSRACYLAIGVTLDGDREVLGHLVAGDRGREVLAGRAQRPPPARRRGRPDRLRRRPDRASRRRSRPSSPRPGCRPASSTRSAARCAGSPTTTARRSPPSCAPSTPPSTPTPPSNELAAFDEKWGERYPMIAETWRQRWPHITPFLALPGRPAPDRLHHQQHREPQPPDPQGDQDPRALPRRTSRHQADLPRDPARPDRLEDPLPLDNRPARPEDPLRRPTPRLPTNQSPRPHTQKVGQSPRADAHARLQAAAGLQPALAVNGQQVVIAAELTCDSPEFSGTSKPMVRATQRELRGVDVGYPSVVLAERPANWHQRQFETVVSDGIQVLVPPDSSLRRGTRPGWTGGLHDAMRRVLATPHGGALYRQRQATNEPVFGQLKFNRDFKRFQRRARAPPPMATHRGDAQPPQTAPPPRRCREA